MGLTASPIYLDTNALIDAVEGQKPHLLTLLRRLKSRGAALLSSELSLAEVLAKPFKENDEALIAIYDDMIRSGGLVSAIPVDRSVLRRSAELRRLGGKLPDAIHVATALITGCKVILSSDKRLPLPDGLKRLPTEEAAALENIA
jgi:predicted nucleic acid-binding protein